MRCLTLANALHQCGSHVSFVCRNLPMHFCELLAQQGHELLSLDTSSSDQPIDSNLAHAAWLEASQEADAQASLAALSSEAWDWLVVDHYALDFHWESRLRPAARKLLVIDDLADRQHDCDILIDQNLYLDMPARYAGMVPGHCQLLLGPRFALLRDEFRELHEKTRFRQGPVARILVFFGGVDADNYTEVALRVLASAGIEYVHVDVVVGAEHPFRGAIETVCRQYGFSCHVQTSRMAELMAAADLAIGAGGTTTWERCCLGLPAIVVSTAENQRRQLSDAAATGLVYAPENTGDLQGMLMRHLMALMENDALRQCISSNGMKLIDGRGALRVVAHMGCTGIEMRKVRPDDSERLYAWRNHPAIRAVSRNAEPIVWGDHSLWFTAVINDSSRQLLIGQRDGEAVGVVRFDILNGQAEVSIYLVPDASKPCRGAELLRSAETWLSENCPDVRILQAHVLGSNARSQGLFSAAGYELQNMLYTKKLH